MTTPRSPLVVIHGPVVRHLRTTTTPHTVITLADAVGLTFSHVAKIERGAVKSVRPEVFDALVRELGVTDPRVLMTDPHATRTGTAPAVPDAA